MVTSVFNRFYDPTTGQFMSIDPDVATTDQPYVFTDDDPLNGTDPLGLCWPSWACKAVDNVTHVVGTGVDFVQKAVFVQVDNVGATSKGAGLIISGAALIIGADSIATAITIATSFGEPEDTPIVPAEAGLVSWVIKGANTAGLGLIVTGLKVADDSKSAPSKDKKKK
jgi:hypothetical protein